MKEKYMISGSSGFIGTALTAHLLERGHEVVGISREIFENFTWLTRYFETQQPDYIIHLAAYGNHASQKSQTDTIIVNVLGTYNMLQASKNVDYKKFYNFSTSSVLLPAETFYSASKAGAERIANVFIQEFNKPVVNIRPYSVYGPGEASFRFIPTVIRALLNGKDITLDENATHDWIYIDDFIAAMLSGETEIGTGIKTTNKEVVELLEDISGKTLNYKPGILRSYDNYNWVAERAVPHMNLRDGLKKTFDHYAKQTA